MEEEQVKKQFILNEEKELTEIPKSLCAAVKYPIKCKLKNAFEVFVKVKHTENYWISNYGRCVNNANRKDKTTFYEHKQGKCHYSIFEMEKSIVSYPARLLKSGKLKVDRKKQKFEKIVGAISDEECQAIISELQEKNEKKIYEIERNKYRRETSPEELVAEHFLKHSGCRTRIWHKDGDENNNWYKNLMYVGVYDYANLKKGKIKWYELDYKQEYIEYENKTNYIAYRVYNSIKKRCGDISNKKNIHECYRDVTMCQEWLDNPRLFIQWYLEHYYTCGDESMAVDKDLFGGDARVYSPDNCCILPQTLNTLLVNSKKRYCSEKSLENKLPFGVHYSIQKDKYYGKIMLSGTDKTIRLSDHDTPEEAFKEYKIMKEADMRLVLARYKEHIPDYIYKKFMTVEVKPY